MRRNITCNCKQLCFDMNLYQSMIVTRLQLSRGAVIHNINIGMSKRNHLPSEKCSTMNEK